LKWSSSCCRICAKSILHLLKAQHNLVKLTWTSVSNEHLNNKDLTYLSLFVTLAWKADWLKSVCNKNYLSSTQHLGCEHHKQLRTLLYLTAFESTLNLFDFETTISQLEDNWIMNAWKESVKTGQNQLSTSPINLPIPPGPSTWQVRPGWHMLFSHWNNADSRWFNDGSWSTLDKSDSIDLMTTSGHISIKFLIASVHCKVKFATNTFGYVKCVDKWRTNRDFQVAPIKQLEWMRC